jgi:hypothetical protein
MSPNAPINEASAVNDGVVRITLRAEILVRRTAVTVDRNAGFDPCLYNGNQSASGSVWNGN